jgi:hypothetical protein
MVTREQILIKIINKIIGEGELVKQQKLMTGLNKATQSVNKTTQSLTGNQKTINSITAGFNKAGETQVRIVKSVNKISQTQSEKAKLLATRQGVLSDLAGKYGMDASKVYRILRQGNITIDKNSNLIDVTGKKVKDLDRVMKQGRRTTQKFQGQYLSLMFVGMALERTFGGIISTQMELWGLNEGFSAMLMVVMIPTMTLLSDTLWPIIEWFMNLPEPAKEVIGIFILLAAITGILLAFFGAFMVLLTSFGMSVAGSSKLLGQFGLVMIGIGFIFIGVMEIIQNWGKSLNKVIRGAGLSILGIGAVLLAFIGWWALIPIAVGAVVWAIAKYWDKLPGYIQKPLIFIYVLLEALGKFIYAMLINPTIAFVKIIWYLLHGQFAKAWEEGKNAVTSVIEPFIDLGKRYTELAERSDKYTAEQKSGLNEVTDASENTSRVMQSTMRNSLETIQTSFNATVNTAELSATTISNSWNESSSNMVESTLGSVNSINDILSRIPTEITTIHKTIERGVGGVTYGITPTKITGWEVPPNPFTGKGGYSTVNPMAQFEPGAKPIYGKQGGGWIPKTGPYILHAGEYVNTIGKTKGMQTETIINLNPVYYVTVADRREFEILIRNNNNKLVEDLRRMVEV